MQSAAQCRDGISLANDPSARQLCARSDGCVRKGGDLPVQRWQIERHDIAVPAGCGDEGGQPAGIVGVQRIVRQHRPFGPGFTGAGPALDESHWPRGRQLFIA